MNIKKRYEVIDAMRGLSIILMVIYHFFFDLTIYGLFPYEIMFCPLVEILQVLFAALFIAMSGASTVFSSNLYKRSFKLLVGAAIITAVTYIFDQTTFVVFGILHFLGLSSLACAFFEKTLRKIKINPIVLTALFALAYLLLNQNIEIKHLWILGIHDSNFASSDYFPIFPWIFAYFLGIHWGKSIRAGKMSSWFYDFKQPFLSWTGRNTLAIYLLHQPVLMGVVWIIYNLK